LFVCLTTCPVSLADGIAFSIVRLAELDTDNIVIAIYHISM